ncbi:DJ-1/PfpI family protein [Aquitalea sp. ASV15]|uniref:DJ-1/PfpI family protein n=1 Tax=Aquitalea sp. ASV15 TaxID=2795104 RepID=UPI0018EAF209|nr:DJ-1/PfpI family protein [Aquitalea sp. ASV15]
MKIAIVTFQGFNELDSFIAAGMLNRMQPHGWEACITSPSEQITSMNGVTVRAQQPLEFANQADVVLFGSGVMTRDFANDPELLARLQLNPARQLIGAQCSGTLLMARLGLIDKLPACTDQRTKPWVEQAGIEVLDAPFHASGNLATAGGCLSAQYLASWVMLKRSSETATREALDYVVPVGEKASYTNKLLDTVRPFISG